MADVDLSEFYELAPDARNHRRPCQVGTALAALSGADVVNVTAAIAASAADVSAGTIERWFKRRDHKVSANAVSNHRKGRCACANE